MRSMTLVVVALAGLALVGCSNMNRTEQSMVSGGAMGAAGGAAIGALTGRSTVAGALIGGAAGTAGGYVVEQMR
ncbi:MAG TPA: YMGG-like glycine zipper-containing protein [Kiloniellales bacterium]|nr:YMGG-like glycine zipper-containing protein [Kiloniellales bacterium]